MFITQELICVICGKTYNVPPYRVNTSKYCSKECWNKRSSIYKTCPTCGKSFKSYKSLNQTYCSRHCVPHAKGESSNAWKDGKSLERDRARESVKLTEWRNAVYSKDNYTCTQCGETHNLHAHHVLSWAEHETERFSVSNGITLCEVCHGKIHNKDFSNKPDRRCIECGKPRKRAHEGTRCQSCALKYWHKQKGHGNYNKICPICGTHFDNKHKEQIYCSVSCGLKSRKGEKRST